MNFSLRIENKTWSPIEREKNTVRLHIDLTTVCNNKCKYCYARADKQNWGLIMSNEYIHSVLFPNLSSLSKYLKDNEKFLDIVLLGGEPTLHPLFSEIVNFLLSKDCRISVTSNGSFPYKNILPNKSIRWAYTFHPSQIYDINAWIKPIINGKDNWWEVAVSPLIDCWDNIEENSKKVYSIIDICHKYDIKVQPTFQFNPYLDGNTHIDMDKVIKYYSYLEKEYPIYEYKNSYINDYNILKDKKNYIKNCICINNNVQLTVKGILRQCCTNKELNWNDLLLLNTIITCPLTECTCYGFLSLYKDIL